MAKSEIKLEVTLDNTKVPEKIEWSATDGPAEGIIDSRAFLLSLWDHKEKSIYALDLWTKEMTVEEMNHMVFQNLISLSNTFFNATKNDAEAKKLKEFAIGFGQRLDVIKKPV